MAQLFSASINVSKIDKSKLVKGDKGQYLNITISINDEEDAYGNIAGIYESQSKDERDAKSPRNYLGNAKLVWSSDSPSTAQASKPQAKAATPSAPTVEEEAEDLPF
jgi:hypothetical protein